MNPSGIRWQFKDNRVYVQWLNESGIDEIKKQVTEVLDECIEHRCHKVLINTTRALTFPNVLDLYELGSFLEKVWKRDIRVAVLVPPKENTRHQFFETVAKNRGLMIESFADARKAKAWLDATGKC
jgi:hypothetical protein